MKLSALKIERFGARANLHLSNLSDQLNVVQGPHDSGQSTIADALHWVLYGNVDGTLNRHLSVSSHGGLTSTVPPQAHVELTIRDREGRIRKITRKDDGTSSGRVTISDATGSVGSAFAPVQLAEVGPQEHRTIFSFDFDQIPSLESVTRLAAARGVEVNRDEHHVQRVADLTSTLQRLRHDLARYAHADPKLMAEQRESLQREIESLELRKQERLLDVERQRSDLLAEIAQRQTQLNSIQVWLQQVDAAIQIRRSQLEAVAREAHEASAQFTQSRQRKIDSIDQQIQHWHEVLDSIRGRYDEIHRALGDDGSHAPSSFVDDESDIRLLLGSLGYHVEDLEQDLIHFHHDDASLDPQRKYDYVRGILGTALHAMRSDVYRLQDRLRRYKSSALFHEYDSERKHLQRCETELTQLLESLTRRRDSLTGSDRLPSFTAENHRVTAQRPWYEDSCDASSHNGSESLEKTEPWTDSSFFTSSSYGPLATRTDPVLEARLLHLQSRRDQIAPRAKALEFEIQDLERRLSQLQSASGVEDTRIMQLREELSRLDEQASAATEYDRLARQVRETEQELARLRGQVGASSVLQEASAILRRITRERYRHIGMLPTGVVAIQDQNGHQNDYTTLDRGVQVQAYLAICLALVAAYRRRAIEHPVVLKDVFIHMTQDQATATAEMLTEFSRRGHQVLFLTEHERVMRLFPARDAKTFVLKERLAESDPRPAMEPTPIPVTRIVEPSPTVPPTRPVATDSSLVSPSVEPERRIDWVAHWKMPESQSSSQQKPVEKTKSFVKQAENVLDAGDDMEVTLGLGSPLDTVPTMDVNLARRFRDIGVVTVGQFLSLDAEDAARRLAKHQIVAGQIVRWQHEVSLQAFLHLGGEESQILVDCGITDPDDLAVADLDHLYRRINGLLSSDETRRRYRPLRQISRQQLSEWIELARRSNYRRRGTHDKRARSSHIRKSIPMDRNEKKDSVRSSVRRDRLNRRRNGRGDGSSSVRKPQPAKTELKFYLNLEDPIVDAPSIGPKTAERFHAVGIHTIAEFLAADPIETARKIDYRRITAEIIAEWQIQAKLATQIPNLRGHDAQILAACEVTDASDLARADEATLFKRVKRFVSTTEGKRILRNGKRPDQEEVADWIRWSQDARMLEAA